jgi:hypothetical protein
MKMQKMKPVAVIEKMLLRGNFENCDPLFSGTPSRGPTNFGQSMNIDEMYKACKYEQIILIR